MRTLRGLVFLFAVALVLSGLWVGNIPQAADAATPTPPRITPAPPPGGPIVNDLKGPTATPPPNPPPAGSWCVGPACPPDTVLPEWAKGSPTPQAKARDHPRDQGEKSPQWGQVILLTRFPEGTKVELTSPEGQVFATLVVGPDGAQHDNFVPPGTYMVKAPGMELGSIIVEPVSGLSIEVIAGATTRVDLR